MITKGRNCNSNSLSYESEYCKMFVIGSTLFYRTLFKTAEGRKLRAATHTAALVLIKKELQINVTLLVV